MIDAEQPAGEDLSIEDRILQCIEEHGEGGISTFAICSELDIRSQIVSPIVERLERGKRIHGVKDRFVFYWHPGPPPNTPQVPAKPQTGYSKENQCPWCGCNNISAEVLEKHKKRCSHNPDREHKQPSPPTKSPAENRTCPDCGTEFPTLTGKRKHKCKSKAEGPDLADLKAELEAEVKPSSGGSSGTCQYCGERRESRIKQHERLCPKNPNRFVASRSSKAEELTEVLVDHVPEPEALPDPEESWEATTVRLTPEQKAKLDRGEIVPASDARKPLSDHVDELLARPRCSTCADEQCGDQGKNLVACDDHEAGKVPDCESGSCTIGSLKPVLVATIPESINIHEIGNAPLVHELVPMFPPEPRDHIPYPDDGPAGPIRASRPKDSLAELVRMHRVRVGREISKLKRVERKLRRRAAAAEIMADRVKAARRTKEKELERFERELAAVKGVSP